MIPRAPRQGISACQRVVEISGRAGRRFPPSRTVSRVGRLIAYALGDPPDARAELDGHLTFHLRPAGRTTGVAFWCGQYEEGLQDFIEAVTHDGDTILDIGANVGIIGIRAAVRAGARAKALLFEPVPANIELARATIRSNGLEDWVTLFPFALGDRDSEITINVEGSGDKSDNAILANPAGHSSRVTAVPIAMRTLDGLLATETPGSQAAVVKIDVEGAEVAVLRGARETLRTARPIIVGEFNSQFMPLYDTTFLDAYAILEALGYRVFSFKSDRAIVEVRPKIGLGDVALIPAVRLADTKADLAAHGWHVMESNP